MILRTKISPWYTATAPKKFKTKASAGKVMLIVFWNPKHIFLTDFLEKGATVNLEHCIENLNNLKKCIMRKEAEISDILFQYDNARPHTSAATTDAIVCMGFTVLPQPAYSPDLAPSNFHLFPQVTEELRSKTSALIKK
jgi:Transposase.